MSRYDYIKEAVNAITTKITESGRKLDGKENLVICTGNCLELDVLPILNYNQENYYQNLFGVLRWAVQLGRIDIHVEVTLISCYLAQP